MGVGLKTTTTRRQQSKTPQTTLVLLLATVLVLAGARPGLAQGLEGAVDGIPSPSIATSLPHNGDPGGFRKWLSQYGVTYGAIYTGEVLGNLRGGLRRGAIVEGKLETQLRIDFEKLAQIQGLTFFSNQFQIHGSGNPGRRLVGNLITISNIEALPSTRLSEAWFEQKFLNDKASIRLGQLTTDSEFFNSRYFPLFINSDWPTITAENLPSGGPAYPLSTPGVRLKFEPVDNMALLVALFNGDPSGPGAADAEVKNRHGLNFRLRDPPLLIAEAQFSRNHDKAATGLASMLRLGGWHHFGNFDDQRFGTDGRSLADPLSNLTPRRWRGNDGIYAVVDQQLYRPPGGDADSGIGVFSRISASPSDRNLINFYWDGGVVFSGMVANRPDDKFGATFIYAQISDRVRGLDHDTVAFSGLPYPIRDFEMTLEFTYQAQIRPGWTFQPNLQFIFHPGGHVPVPGAASFAPIKDATVIGARTVINY